jgi:hypothetical protein
MVEWLFQQIQIAYLYSKLCIQLIVFEYKKRSLVTFKINLIGRRSNEIFDTEAKNVISKCYIRYRSLDKSEDIEQWSESGEFRFYFSRIYDRHTGICSIPEKNVQGYGQGQGTNKVFFSFL